MRTPPRGNFDSFYRNFSHVWTLIFIKHARGIHGGMFDDVASIQAFVHEKTNDIYKNVGNELVADGF